MFSLAFASTGWLVDQSRAEPITLESVDWIQQDGPPTTLLGGSLGSGTVTGTTDDKINAGVVWNQDWGGYAFATGYTTSLGSSVALGVLNNATAPQQFKFSQSVTSPYLFFNWADPHTSFNFGSYNWTLLGATFAHQDGTSVVIEDDADSADPNAGFLVRLNENFGPNRDLLFDFVDNGNNEYGGNSVGFTIAQETSSVPEIDPAGMGSVFALVTGALGLLERRRVKAV